MNMNNDQMSLVETDQIDPKIQIVLRQTNYTEHEAREKLKQFQFNELDVIRDYMGIPAKTVTTKKSLGSSSINQAIYKQLRGHLDDAMKTYRDRQEAMQR
jgi:hypothetical protein